MTERATFLMIGMWLGAISLSGCGGGGSSVAPPVGSDTGSISVRVDFTAGKSRTIPSGTQTVFVSVTGAALSTAPSATLTPTNPSTTFTNIPVGIKIVRADAYNGTAGTTSFGELLGSGFTEVNVVKGQTARAEVEVNQVGFVTREMARTENLNGVTVTVFTSTTGEETFFSSDPQGLKLHGERTYAPVVRSRGQVSRGSTEYVEVIFEPPVLIPNGLEIGETFSTTSSVFVNDVVSGKLKSLVRYEGNEGVKVPAGEFSGNVPRISITFEQQLRQVSPPDILGIRKQTLWFGANTGPVMIKTERAVETASTDLSILVQRSSGTPRGSGGRAFQANTYFPLTIGTIFDYAIAMSSSLPL